MTSVFLSYDREDTDRARLVATELESAGHDVWWDQHIRAGSQYNKEIEEALNNAKAVVVLWSARSINSPWVRDEAAAGRDLGRLVPATIDGAQPPLGFRQYQTIDLSRWKGRKNDPKFAELLGAIAGHDDGAVAAAKPAAIARQDSRHPSFARNRHYSIWIGLILLMVGAGAAWLLLRPTSAVPTLAVAAAQPNAASNALARDLLVKLGELQSVTGGNLRLIEQVPGSNGGSSTLTFEVEDTSANGQTKADLVLFDGRDGSLIWSRSFERLASEAPDLRQQLAYVAARVLSCALQGLSPDGGRLSADLFKSYLSGCAALAEIGDADLQPVARTMLKITEEAPKFAPAWGLLLLAEAESVRPESNEGESDEEGKRVLRRHIDVARQVDPKLPEIYLAEIALLPRRDFTQAMDLIDRANEEHNDNSTLLSNRSGLLQNVGRNRESIKDARRAAELDPISPFLQNALIATLSYGGEIEAARAELKRAERLWPGTASLRDAQFRFHYRFGDPRIALQDIAAEDKNHGPDIYLQTRLDPTPAKVAQMKSYVSRRLKVVGLPGLAFMIQAYGEFGQIDDIYAELQAWPNDEGMAVAVSVFFRPALAGARRDPRFMQIAQRSGLLTYWMKSGRWPDFCSEPDLPYDCKAEAAKLAA